jgi:DNA-3-methyladenine glycosylase
MAQRVAKLSRAFYARDSLIVARELIGMHLAHDDAGTLRVGRIVETEAYQGPEDQAAHSARGRRTARTEVMFGPPGYAYVYLIYGFWNCFNVVTQEAGTPHAVLIRGLEPVSNLPGSTWGPGLLCREMHIDRSFNGEDLRGDRLWIQRPSGRQRPLHIESSTRIGVEYAGEWAKRPWRFFDRDSPFVSTVTPAVRMRAGILGAPKSKR